MLTTGWFDAEIEVGPFSGRTYADVYRERATEHAKLMDSYVEAHGAFHASAVAYGSIVDAILPFMAEFAEEGDGAVEVVGAGAAVTASEARWRVVFALLMSFLIAVIGGYVLTRGLRHRMGMFSERLRDIASGGGDLTVRIDDTGKDEFAAMGRDFNMFLDTLQSLVGTVAERVAEVANAASELNRVGGEMATAAETAAVQVEQVSSASGQIEVQSLRRPDRLQRRSTGLRGLGQ